MATIWQEESGGIRYWWVRLEGEPARRIAMVERGLAEQELIERAEQAAQLDHEHEAAAAELRARWPEAVIADSWLPRRGVRFDGAEGWYVYALKPRKTAGPSRVLEAIPVRY